MSRLTIIAAVAANNCIGKDNKIPWHLPEDFKHFKETTKGHPIIMGRNTWESLPKKPLPGRENIVIYSLSKGHITGPEEGKSIYGSWSLLHGWQMIAIDHLKAEQVFVIGGAHLYAEAMHYAHELIITHLPSEYEGDTFFPPIDSSIWEVTEEKPLVGEVVVKYYKKR